MGAAASTESEKEDLRKVYSVFSSLGGSKSVSSGTFSDITRQHAPKLWHQLQETGDGPNALIALQEQLEGARIKLNSSTSDSVELNTVCSRSKQLDLAPIPLNYDWTKDLKINLQKGLGRGLLNSVPLPMVQFIIGEDSSSPQHLPVSLDIPKESHATVVHIKTKPEMNGQSVLVLEKDMAKERYVVKFNHSEKLVLLKRENLVVVGKSSNLLVRFTITALVDTGAERSALSPNAAEKAGLSPLIDSSFARKIGGVGSANGYGRVHYTKIHFRSQITGNQSITDESNTVSAPHHPLLFETGFDVIEWPSSAIDFDAILGIDFLSRYNGLLRLGSDDRDLTLTLNSDQFLTMPLL